MKLINIIAEALECINKLHCNSFPPVLQLPHKAFIGSVLSDELFFEEKNTF